MKTKNIIIILFWVLLIFPGHSWSQSIDRLDDLTGIQIDSAVNAIMTTQGMVGVGLGVVYNGDLAYTKGYGWATEGTKAFDTNTTVRWASVSKTVTGLLACKLWENGDIELDDDISIYVPGFNDRGIAIRDLLSHRSGIAHYIGCPDSTYAGPFDADSTLGIVQGCTVCFSPSGSSSRYTTFGSNLLGVIIDVVGQANYGKSFMELADLWIKTPMNLVTFWENDDPSDPNMAKGYRGPGDPISTHQDVGWKTPGGGFYSNINDFAKYAKGIINYNFVDSITSEEMWTIQNATQDSAIYLCAIDLDEEYGLSFKVENASPSFLTKSVGHTGRNITSSRSRMNVYPEQNFAVVLFTNTQSGAAEGGMNQIHDAVRKLVVCPEKRNFQSLVNWASPSIYESNNTTIMSNINLPDNELIIDSSQKTILKPGFVIPAGRVFHALIDGCGGDIQP